MICKNCGQQMSDNAKFCGHCGQRVIAVPERKCARCNHAAEKEQIYCKHCGYRLPEQQ